MKAGLSMLLLAAFAALALVAHKGGAFAATPAKIALAAPKFELKPAPRPPATLVPDFSADQPAVAVEGIKRPPFTTERPKAPIFTDIGTEADLPKPPPDQTIEGTGTVNMGLAQVPGVGTALKVQAAVEQVMAVVLGGGNAAGLSQQQLDYACPGGKCSPNAVAIAEGRLGAKSVLINGEYVLVGGAGLGGPGLADLAAARAEQIASTRAAPRTLLG